MKLSKTQQELLDSMKAGDVIHYMRYMGTFNPNPYYFRQSDYKRVTSAANALIEKGLARMEGKYNDQKLVLVAQQDSELRS